MFNSEKKFTAMSVALCVVAALTAGCASTKQAGLIYSSAVSMGLGMEVKTADATAPVSINIGFKTLDVAYVPIAVMERRADGSELAEKIWASHSQQNGNAERCRVALQNSKETKAAAAKLNPAGTPTPSANADDLPSECDAKRDSMSVYGQFNGDASAKGNDRSAGLMVGRVFATGVAAQNVSAAAVSLAYAACAAAVKASGITVAADIDAETKRVCGGHHR